MDCLEQGDYMHFMKQIFEEKEKKGLFHYSGRVKTPFIYV